MLALFQPEPSNHRQRNSRSSKRCPARPRWRSTTSACSRRRRRSSTRFIASSPARSTPSRPTPAATAQRVPELTKMLARAACDAKEGPFRDFDLDDDELGSAAHRELAARLRQGDHARVRRRQGDQARDDLRPHPRGAHALRGAQARRRDRVSEGASPRAATNRSCGRRSRPSSPPSTTTSRSSPTATTAASSWRRRSSSG